MRRFLSVMVFSFVVVGLVACGDDDSTGPGEELSDQELAALAEVIFEQGFAFAFTSGLASQAFAPDFDGPSGAPIGPIDVGPEDQACELGGVVTISGTISGDVTQEGVGTINFSGTQEHKNCGVQSDEGIQFTLNGNPNTTTDLTIDTQATGAFTIDGTYGGGIAWATGDRSGTCDISINVDASGNFETETVSSGTVTGTVCGRNVDETIN